jgi:hypothetical protein
VNLVIMTTKIINRLWGRPSKKIITIALICLVAVSVCEFVVFGGLIRTQIGKAGVESFTDEELKDFLIDQYILKHNITVHKYYEKRKVSFIMIISIALILFVWKLYVQL